MGHAQVQLAGQLSGLEDPPTIGAAQPPPISRPLRMEQFPVHGLQLTGSENAIVTDSAAAATALACGRRTANGLLGLAADGVTRLESVAELARDRGMRVGLVTSVSLDHATPAAFYAHQASRANGTAILRDLVESRFDYIGGGGLSVGGSVDGSASPWDELVRSGFTIVRGADAIALSIPTQAPGKTYALHEPLADHNAMPYASERTDGELRLADYTRLALTMLDGPRGFFLMVEGGRIDWAGHENDAVTAAREILELDRALAEALSFQRNRPNDTLIVVTADHETGGLSQLDPGGPPREHALALARQRNSLAAFTKRWTARVRDGSARRFEDFIELAREQWGLVAGQTTSAHEPQETTPGTWTSTEVHELRQAFDTAPNADAESVSALPAKAQQLFLARHGLHYAAREHTAAPVPIYASGPTSEDFAVVLQNDELGRKLIEIVSGLAVRELGDLRRPPQPQPHDPAQ